MDKPEIDVRYVASLARLELTDAEVDAFQGQISGILNYMDKLNSVDVDGIEPTAYSAPVMNVMREDVARPGFSQEEALLNAPQKSSDSFLVTKVVE